MMYEEIMKTTIEKQASDLHITVGSPPILRINGILSKMNDEIITIQDSEQIAREITPEKNMIILEEKGETDFSFSMKGLGRFRVNVFRQRGTYGLAIRPVVLEIPKLSDLGLPFIVGELTRKMSGLILVTGPTGSGKTTTLASMINKINEEKHCHILTLEDPVEYIHKHKKGIVNQREIGSDSLTFANALRAALREDPDVILVGEMRDIETMEIAITAAETGHLVLSTLHTLGASKTVDRIIDIFPSDQQQQIRVQLASVLQAVVSQQLLTRIDKSGRIIATEIMIMTPAIRNLIREGKTHQIDSLIQTGSKIGMQTMDNSLAALYAKKMVSYDDVISRAGSYENMTKMLTDQQGR